MLPFESSGEKQTQKIITTRSGGYGEISRYYKNTEEYFNLAKKDQV